MFELMNSAVHPSTAVPNKQQATTILRHVISFFLVRLNGVILDWPVSRKKLMLQCFGGFVDNTVTNVNAGMSTHQGQESLIMHMPVLLRPCQQFIPQLCSPNRWPPLRCLRAKQRLRSYTSF